MDKDLHSGKVDWNIVIDGNSIYLLKVDGGVVMVGSEYWVGGDICDEVLVFPTKTEVKVKDGEIVWQKFPDGSEYSLCEDGYFVRVNAS